MSSRHGAWYSRSVGGIVQVVEVQHRAELDVLELVHDQQREGRRVGGQRRRDRTECVRRGGRTDIPAWGLPGHAASARSGGLDRGA